MECVVASSDTYYDKSNIQTYLYPNKQVDYIGNSCSDNVFSCSNCNSNVPIQIRLQKSQVIGQVFIYFKATIDTMNVLSTEHPDIIVNGSTISTNNYGFYCDIYSTDYQKTLLVNSKSLSVDITFLSKYGLTTQILYFYFAIQYCPSLCLSCDINNLCKQCTNGYFVTESNTCDNNCQLNQGYFVDQFNCRKCGNLCKTCQNSTSCLSCNVKYYLNENICSPCDASCLNCFGPSKNSCTVCSDSTNYISVSNSCVPQCDQNQYIDTTNVSQKQCKQCQQFCKTCSNSTTCDNCIDGYSLDSNKQCQPCNKACLTCNGLLNNNCVTCANQAYFSPSNICVPNCDQNQYVITANGSQKYCKQCQLLCKTCSNSTTCDSCIDGYNLDSYKQCQPCDKTCQTCSGTLNINCIICKSPLLKQLSTNLCVEKCDTNEFINQNNQCQQCHKTCASCDGATLNSCLSCFKNTYLFNKQCVNLCPNGFLSNFDLLTCDPCSNYLSPQCNPCFASCQLCDLAQVQSGQCNSCYLETRNLNQNQQCTCNNPNDKRNIFYQCSFQNIAVLDAYLSATDPILTIDFGSPLQSIGAQNPQSLCKYLFNQTTQGILSPDSQCKIVGSLIQIYLGESSTIMENDPIYILPGILQFTDYQNYFINTFYRNFVRQIPSGIPQLQFNYNYIENSCNPINITLANIENDAGRKFAKLQWTLKQISDTANSQQMQQITQILQVASQNKNTTLIIDPIYISPNQNISIQFSYQLKVNQTGQQTFNIFYQKQKQIRIIYYQSQYPPIYRFMSLSFYFQFSIQTCVLGQITHYQEPFDLQIVSSNLKKLIASKYNQSNFEYDIPSYSLPSNQPFNFSITLSLCSDYSVVSVKNITVDILITSLYLQIIGGSNFIVSFKDKFVLNTNFRDYEIENPTSPQDIIINWTCSSLSTNDHNCYDYNNNKIKLEQGLNSITFAAKTFSPYTIVLLTATGQKDSRQTNSTATCFFSELDIPPLQVLYSAQLSQKINLNQDLNFILVYSQDISSDILSYAGALIYKNEVVGAIKFDYQQVKFRIWNYFQDLDLNQPTLQIRFSVYNPQYVMPSLSTISFQINIPPQNCTLSISPLQGVALETIFNLQFLFCTDEDLPLTYQFFYYNSAGDAQQEIDSPWNILRRQIQDQTINNSLQTVLPQGNLVIMIQAMDSQLGITNQTLSIQVTAQNKQLDQYSQIVNQLIQQTNQNSVQTTDQLVTLCIAGEDLSKNTQSQFFQQNNYLQTMLITNIQQLSLQIPKFSLLSTFANKVLSQLTQNTFPSQQQNQSDTKKQIFEYIQNTIQNTVSSMISNNQSSLQQNNDIQLQNIVDSFKILNSSVSLNTKNQLEDYQNYENISIQLGIMLSNMSLPNQGEVILNGNLSTLLSDKITFKNIDKYSLPVSNSLSQNATQIYSITRNNYEQNIYENTTSFQNYVEQYKNASKNFTYSKNRLISTQIQHTNEKGLQQNLSIMYQFDNVTSNNQQKMACIQQNDPIWSDKNCQIIKNNEKQICFCDQQKPTTIIEDLELIVLKNKNLQTAFGEQGVQNIENFNDFYKYLAFWVLFTFTSTQVFLFFYGKCLDAKTLLKRFQSVQQEQKIDQQQQNEQLPENKLNKLDNQNQQEKPQNNDNDDEDDDANKLSPFTHQTKSNEELYQNCQQNEVVGSNNTQVINIKPHRRKRQKFLNILQQDSLRKQNLCNEQQQFALGKPKIESNQFEIVRCQSTTRSFQNKQVCNTQTNTQNQIEDLQKLEAQQKLLYAFQKLSKIKMIAIFHQFFTIFYVYDSEISRPIRFTLFYIKNIHTLAISILFAGFNLLDQQILIAFINSFILKVSSGFIVQTFKRGNCLKRISIFFQICLSLFYFYIILSVSSGKTAYESNQFILLFLLSITMQFILIECITAFAMIAIIHSYMKNINKRGFFQRLFNLMNLQQIIENIDT